MNEAQIRTLRLKEHLKFDHGECCDPLELPRLIRTHRHLHIGTANANSEDHIRMRLPYQQKEVLNVAKKQFGRGSVDSEPVRTEEQN